MVGEPELRGRDLARATIPVRLPKGPRCPGAWRNYSKQDLETITRRQPLSGVPNPGAGGGSTRTTARYQASQSQLSSAVKIFGNIKTFFGHEMVRIREVTDWCLFFSMLKHAVTWSRIQLQDFLVTYLEGG